MQGLLPPLLLPLLLLLLLPAAECEQSGRDKAASLLPRATIASIRRGLQAGDFNCKQLIAEQLRRVEAFNPKLKAFIAVTSVSALAEAAARDATAAGSWGSLHCVPVVVKDNIDVASVPTTNGAPAFVNMRATGDSVVVQRIRTAGGIVIGKANMAEMSDSGTDSNSTVGGACSNPWNPGRSCLGSSGGSAAAVAAGLAVVGVGTDTEGSVIGPCAAAGLLCVRPTRDTQFAAVMPGVYPAFSRQDEIGLMANSAEDFGTAFDAVYYTNMSDIISASKWLNGTRIRVLQNFYKSFKLGDVSYEPDSEMVRLHQLAIRRLANLGAEIEDYELTMPELGAKLQQIMAATMTKPQCANSCMKKSIDDYLARRSADPYRQTADLWAARSQLPASYQQKLNTTLQQQPQDVCNDTTSCSSYVAARRTMTSILQELLGNASLAAMPFTAKLPQLHGEQLTLGDQISPALNPYTGWPSLSLPVGFARAGQQQPQGLPVAMVLLAPGNGEGRLLQAAGAYLRRFAERKVPDSAPKLEIKAASGVASAAVFVAAAAAAAAVVGRFGE